MLPAVAGMTGAHHHTWLFSVEMGSCKHFCPGLPETAIYSISASQVLGFYRREPLTPHLNYGFFFYFPVVEKFEKLHFLKEPFIKTTKHKIC
jgi:hypothetical protein